MRKIQMGMLGCGTVGTGVVRLLEMNRQRHMNYAGAEPVMKKILVADPQKKRDPVVDSGLLTGDPEAVLGDPEIEIVVEVMGGTGLAREYILRALNSGKNVVTANKDLMAQDGEELFEAAARNGVDLYFEASVAGGIPIIGPLKHSLAANRITRVMGIINGTTNFILTKMYDEGSEFSEVLKLAQELGYAETDPTADVEGWDAARKIAILASIAFNTRVNFRDVYMEGITKITPMDIEYARKLNCTIKLVGVARDSGDSVEARVHPVLLPLSHPLAKVDGVYNAVYVEGDAVGDVMFQGAGAGEMPTASAVTGDILAVARNIVKDVRPRDNCSCYLKKKILSVGETRDKYFTRMSVVDRPGVLAQIAGVFGRKEVSIDSLIQTKHCEGMADLALITDVVLDSNFRAALEEIKDLEPVRAIESVIRVEQDS